MPGKQVTVVTQNIDDLHQRAGSDPVWCVHGNLEWSRCLGCGHRVKTHDLAGVILSGEIPRHSCGGVYKPEVTFFGEMLPELDFGEAQAAIRNADVLVVVGSSLVVYPGRRPAHGPPPLVPIRHHQPRPDRSGSLGESRHPRHRRRRPARSGA